MGETERLTVEIISELQAKLDKIEQIIENEKDISALCYYDKIKEVLEKDN